MGSFYTGCKVENHEDPKKVAVVPRLMVYDLPSAGAAGS
jgi:hypothetical protein